MAFFELPQVILTFTVEGSWKQTPMTLGCVPTLTASERMWVCALSPTLSPWGPSLQPPLLGSGGQPSASASAPSPPAHPQPRPPPVCLALLGSLARGQDGVGDYQDRRAPGVLRLDLFAASLRLGGAQQAMALDCLDGVQEGGGW